jgi:predicted nucleotidyltransferase
MVDEAIIAVIQRYLSNVEQQGVPVVCGVLFGSQATGHAHRWSDIDLLVVSPRFDAVRKRSDIDLLWHIAAQTDNRIEPIAVGERQFAEDDSSAIIEMARREGQVIPLAK